MTPMAVEVWGSGTRAVLVHGSLATGPSEWEGQRPLAGAGYQLVVPTRRAYVGAGKGEDFLVDGGDVAELLLEGAHLVGHSYGALGAIVAAQSRPERVRSLVLAEPPLFDVAAGHTAVAAMRSQLEQLFVRDLSDREFLTRFLDTVGTPLEDLDDGALDALAGLAGPLRGARQPWHTPPSLEWLAAAPFPVVVVSGNHHPAFSAICESIARITGATLCVAAGAGHEVQSAEGFNAVLQETWRRAEGG